MKGSSTTSSLKSESEKEKTKMRERQRRAITGKIFHGLRKHGGYRLSPRADINEVLRNLAAEAGWTVHSDGTTFRSSSVGNCCPVCGATTTPTSSVVLAGGGGGGECSTTASPRHFVSVTDGDIPTPFYSGGFPSVFQQFESYSGGFIGDGALPVALQQKLREEARASKQSTPVGSPLCQANHGS